MNQVEPVHVMITPQSWDFSVFENTSGHCFISIKLDYNLIKFSSLSEFTIDIISQMVRFCFDNNQHSMRFHDLIGCPVVFAGTRYSDSIKSGFVSPPQLVVFELRPICYCSLLTCNLRSRPMSSAASAT